MAKCPLTGPCVMCGLPATTSRLYTMRDRAHPIRPTRIRLCTPCARAIHADEQPARGPDRAQLPRRCPTMPQPVNDIRQLQDDVHELRAALRPLRTDLNDEIASRNNAVALARDDLIAYVDEHLAALDKAKENSPLPTPNSDIALLRLAHDDTRAALRSLRDDLNDEHALTLSLVQQARRELFKHLNDQLAQLANQKES